MNMRRAAPVSLLASQSRQNEELGFCERPCLKGLRWGDGAELSTFFSGPWIRTQTTVHTCAYIHIYCTPYTQIKPKKYIIWEFWRLRCKTQGINRAMLFLKTMGGSFLPLSSLWWFAGSIRHSLNCSHTVLLCVVIATRHTSCVSLFSDAPFCKDAGHIGWGPFLLHPVWL